MQTREARKEEIIRGGRRRREPRRTSQRRILRSVYMCFFSPFFVRCAFRGGLAKLINVNLLT